MTGNNDNLCERGAVLVHPCRKCGEPVTLVICCVVLCLTSAIHWSNLSLKPCWEETAVALADLPPDKVLSFAI